MERLDRAMCFMDWRTTFAEGFVHHLPRVFSNHCPIMLSFHSNHIPCNVLRSFRFEAIWFRHEKFAELVRQQYCLRDGNIVEKVNSMTNILRDWNRDSFWCIFQRKKQLFARLHGI